MSARNETGPATDPQRLEADLEAGQVVFGGELRALAEDIRPRADFVTSLREEVQAGLAAPPPRPKPLQAWKRRVPRRFVMGAALVLALALLIVLAVLVGPRLSQGSLSVAQASAGLEVLPLRDRLPDGAAKRLGMGRALSFATGPEGEIAVGSSVDVCRYGADLEEAWCARQEAAVTRLAFAPGGDLLAAGRADGRVILLDRAGRQIGQPIEFGIAAVVGLAWLPGPDALLAAATQGAQVGVWDVERESFHWMPRRAAGQVWDLALDPAQGNLALASDEGVLVLDAGSGLLLHREITDPALPVSLAFTPDGRLLVAGLDGPEGGDVEGTSVLVAWQVSDWTPYDSWKVDSAARSLWVGMGERVAAVTESGRLWLGTLHQPELRSMASLLPGSPLAPKQGGQEFLVVSRDGSVVAASMAVDAVQLRPVWEDYTGPAGAVSWMEQGHIQAFYEGGFLAAWDVDGADLEGKRHLDFTEDLPAQEPGRFLAWSPDGEQVLVGLGNDAAVFEAGSGREMVRLTGSRTEVVQGAFSPDGGQVVTADRTARLRIWDRADGRLVRVHQPLDIGATVTGLGWLPGLAGPHIPAGERGSASSLAVTWLNSARYALDLVDPVSGQDRRFTGISESLGKVAWSPDGRWVASVVGKGVMVWDLQTGQARWTLALDPADWRSVSMAISPDSRYLATGGRTITIWDLSRGEALRTFPGQTAYAAALAFRPDGRALVSGSSDGTLLIWPVP